MYLAEQTYKIIRNSLVGAGISAYSDMVPTETAYPFCMYEISNQDPTPDTAFEKDYETLQVRFNLFDNADNPSQIAAIGEEIETLFDRTKLSFVDGTGGMALICNYKTNDEILYEDDAKRWKAIIEFNFTAQRTL